MQLDSTFSVVAPIDEVWDTLMDFERVAGCVPGRADPEQDFRRTPTRSA